ncbi:MAG: prepilin-type N-terminal cleavage/methylation domain-containing protein [Solirubrobacteraceae bacterium]
MKDRRIDGEHGFTIVEVMVAMMILMLGVIGTVTLVDAANSATVKTRARENANNLAREVIENARVVDYDALTAAGVAPALQAKAGLADSTPSTPAWTVVRGKKTYTLEVQACTYDDAKDSVAATHDSSHCASTPVVSPATDINADDFRRVDVTITWSLGNSTTSLKQTALIINPSGGFGPRIVSFLPNGETVPSKTITDAAPVATRVDFTVRTSYAASVRWQADDAVSQGDATGGPTTWAVRWELGAPLDPISPYVRDGTYQVTAQPFDSVGIPGDVRPVTVVVNRSAPVAPKSLTGGRNSHYAAGDVVELKWAPNLERDVIGYRVYRIDPAGGPDKRVCPTSGNTEISQTFCTDESPAAAAAEYYVTAVDRDPNANKREGTASAHFTAPAVSSARPTFPGGTALTASLTNGNLPKLDWDPPATDSDGTILFYRIYRDSGTGLADRYDFTESASPTYVDPRPGTTTVHTYWVTAVDDSYNESDPIGPVDSP